jgi:hypothetical protein
VVGAHDIVGDVGARLTHFTLAPDTDDELGRVWIGIRSAGKHPALANFSHIWECEAGTNNASESGITDVADATASGGNRVNLAETDLNWDGGNWYEVLELAVEDTVTGGNETDNFGTFLWLLRAKVDSGTWNVQYRWGYQPMGSTADFIHGEIVEVSNTSWDFHEMGIQDLPLTNIKAFWNYGEQKEGDYCIQIWATRTSGSGDLDLDCVGLVPIDEGYCVSWGFDIVQSDAAGNWQFAESPSGEAQAIVDRSASLADTCPFDAHNFRLPPGDGRMIIFYARDTSSDIADVLDVNNGDVSGYFERWGILRGSE